MEQESKEKVKREFGKYYLLDRIGSGGMAEIYRARPSDLDANGRIVVIKRILPHVAHDPVFTEMFKGEIQVCMGFSHPNTVQIYDFGAHRGQSYIAMEYIEGLDLRLLLTAFKNAGRRMPIEVALTVAEQAARGLHYAHTFENSATGDRLNLIHRDVSPQNILVSYDGNVKVIDFGISKAFGAAKAAIQLPEATQVGVIKGKVSYLSPEQAMQRPIDARSDIFSLGIVLWECLTLQKLFKTEGFREVAPLLMIQNCERYIVPPSALNPEVPKELDQIVLKALAPRAEDRYQTAEEFEGVLHDFLVNRCSGFGVQDTGRFMKQWFKTRIEDDKKRLLELNQRAQTTLQEKKDSSELIEETATVPTIASEAHFASQNSPNWFTRKKIAGIALYVLTIVLLKLDGHYFFFEKLFRAPERTHMALTEDFRPKSIMLNLRMPPKMASVREIHINNLPLDPSKPTIRVPLDQTLRLVVRYGKSGQPREMVKDFILRSDYFAGLRVYTMPLMIE